MKLQEIKINVKPKEKESKCQLTEEEEKVLRGTEFFAFPEDESFVICWRVFF